MEYEIYWGDLNEETQNELLELMGDKGNLDVIPIATIPIEMEESPLRILKVEPGEVPYEKEIKDDLHSVQEEVGGGLFQPVYLDDGIVLC